MPILQDFSVVAVFQKSACYVATLATKKSFLFFDTPLTMSARAKK